MILFEKLATDVGVICWDSAFVCFT